MSADRPLRVFFYVQHLLGIGHLARASRICNALAAQNFEVTVVTGGMPVAGFPGPAVRHVELPPVAAGTSGFSALVDAEGRAVDEAFEHRRRDMLLAAFDEARPDVVITEAFPFGRRQVRFELIPLLEKIEAMDPKPLVVASLRDILQEKVKPGRNEESIALALRYFDRVLVHGDPDFVTLQETFPLADQIADKLVYTGLVAAPAVEPSEDRYDVVVSAGGGAVGRDLLDAGLQAARSLPDTLSWCLITGPNLPQGDFDRLASAAPENVTITRFRRDFPAVLAGARLSVSQAGYNTVCDVLNAGCRSLLVPFTTGGETEQTARALRLQHLGLAKVLTEDDLSADTMTSAVDQLLASPPPGRHVLDLDGAWRTGEILRELHFNR